LGNYILGLFRLYLGVVDYILGIMFATPMAEGFFGKKILGEPYWNF